MPTLFEEVTLSGMRLRSRFVRSATFEGMADSTGEAKDVLVDLTGELAKGEVGLIISSHAYIEPRGRVRASQLGIHNDTLVPGLSRLAGAAHAHGSKTLVQIAHGGCTANDPVGEWVGPSAMTLPDGRTCRELAKSEIAGIVQDFRRAARRSMDAGFDGVQIHSAHAYLLSEFLSPYFNRRTDEYGGPLVNRSRIHREVLAAVRAEVGDDAPVFIKMNSDDFVDGGFTHKEMVEVARMLESEGITAVEISGGTPFSPANRGFSRPGIQSPEEEVYYLDAAKMYKDAVSVPLVLVGGIRTFAVAQKLVEEGVADLIALSRPLIREPHLVRRWREGDTAQATCIHCNLCFGPARAGEGMYCVAERKQREKETKQTNPA
jgi:2,4-dienoyl-CoA reductase-like NADH-dependent reductase (Old Yellow Enzyme family)